MNKTEIDITKLSASQLYDWMAEDERNRFRIYTYEVESRNKVRHEVQSKLRFIDRTNTSEYYKNCAITPSINHDKLFTTIAHIDRTNEVFEQVEPYAVIIT